MPAGGARPAAMPTQPACQRWPTCPSMPSAAPSSMVARNVRPASAGSANVGSADVRSVNHSVPPSASDGSCGQAGGRGWGAGQACRQWYACLAGAAQVRRARAPRHTLCAAKPRRAEKNPIKIGAWGAHRGHTRLARSVGRAAPPACAHSPPQHAQWRCAMPRRLGRSPPHPHLYKHAQQGLEGVAVVLFPHLHHALLVLQLAHGGQGGERVSAGGKAGCSTAGQDQNTTAAKLPQPHPVPAPPPTPTHMPLTAALVFPRACSSRMYSTSCSISGRAWGHSEGQQRTSSRLESSRRRQRCAVPCWHPGTACCSPLYCPLTTQATQRPHMASAPATCGRCF